MSERPANPNDIVSRYLYSKKEFSINGVKHIAFIDKRNLSELSVCLISDLSESEIWQIATIVRADKPVKARADLTISDIKSISIEKEISLNVIIDGVPHPNHANIKFPPLQDSVRRVIAAELANKSALLLAP